MSTVLDGILLYVVQLPKLAMLQSLLIIVAPNEDEEHDDDVEDKDPSVSKFSLNMCGVFGE
jgi:hypothetical protein